jgi:hypothetical protein
VRPQFWFRLAAIALPFALAVLVLSGALVYVGESMPLAWVVEMQHAGEVLYRPRYGNRDLTFKTLSANRRAADVLAVGSSHVLQIRAPMFTRAPERFYNAGAPGWSFADIEAFLDGLHADAWPQVLLLGIDHPWFNAAYTPAPIPPPVNDFEHLFAVNRAYMQSVVEGDALAWEQARTRTQPDGTPALGLRAIRDGHGFRSDGSEQYGDFLVGRFLDPATERRRHLDWLRDGREMYIPGDVPDPAALAAFERILARAAAHDTTVVAFLPPFAPTQMQALNASTAHGYLRALMPALEARARVAQAADRRVNVHLFDFSDGGQFGADADFFDGWHGSERVYLRLIRLMAGARPQLFAPYTDGERLRAIDGQALDTFRVFGG